MAAVSANNTTKRGGAGKANWGRLGDENFDTTIDEQDPAYDSADELFENAFGSCSKNTMYDWSAVIHLSDEDDLAMNEIEDAIREEWVERADREQKDIEDEGEAFFTE